jgi:hypothetical protein
VSWKFNQKTKTEGRVFIDFIKNNPGYDVYFINPYPHEVLLFRNVWLQGEACHPGLIEFAQSIMNRLRYDIDLRAIENSHDTALYCNFWVGNAQFWDQYMEFTKPIFDYLRTRLSDEEKRFLNRPADKARDATATYLSFIMERLFSTFLVSHKKIRSLSYEYPCRELQIIQTMRDNHWEAIQRMQQSQQPPAPVESIRRNFGAPLSTDHANPIRSGLLSLRRMINRLLTL